MAEKKKFQFKRIHKSLKGGLTEAGRKAYNRATGSNLKKPQPEAQTLEMLKEQKWLNLF